MKIGLYGRLTAKTSPRVLGEFIRFLMDRGIDFCVFRPYRDEWEANPPFRDLAALAEKTFE
ncbi:MAG: hypothetical protein RMM53_12435, partial [Bacteroidia bacterium]|nr:hypothetical protein [Bacteroidia bacterium]MDW8335014.1 hypothetical protein [Bacteroidia bacterium]